MICLVNWVSDPLIHSKTLERFSPETLLLAEGGVIRVKLSIKMHEYTCFFFSLDARTAKTFFGGVGELKFTEL